MTIKDVIAVNRANPLYLRSIYGRQVITITNRIKGFAGLTSIAVCGIAPYDGGLCIEADVPECVITALSGDFD